MLLPTIEQQVLRVDPAGPALSFSLLHGQNKRSIIPTSRFEGYRRKKLMKYLLVALLNANFGAIALPTLYHVGQWLTGNHRRATPDKPKSE
jgi:hypothetical protein